MSDRRFYVAVRNGAGVASHVHPGTDPVLKRELAAFYRDYAGLEIRQVGGIEMQRLMTVVGDIATNHHTAPAAANQPKAAVPTMLAAAHE